MSLDLFREETAQSGASSAASEPYAWWASLNHGGLLISPSKLNHFPSYLPPMPAGLSERLRREITRLHEGGEERLGSFLDTVLEDVLGLSKVRWTKGSDVSRAWSKPAVTREIVRPRRVWLGPNGAVLPVFVPDASLGIAKDASVRLGVGRGKRPVSRVVEWLRRVAQDAAGGPDSVPVPRVALLATGRQLRLIHAGADYDAFCEWDTALWFQEGAPGLQVGALLALLSAEALVPEAEGQTSPLLAAIQESRQGQAELSSALGERVRQAVELLIRESSPALEPIDAGDHPSAADPARVSRRDIYVAATRIVMRCVVILFAEARDLLPRSNAIYEQSYGIQALRGQLDRLAGGRAAERLRHSHGAWPRLVSLFRLVYHGSQHEALPVTRYGGGLFTPGDVSSTDPVLRALAAFESAANAPSDHAVHALLELLCRSRVRVRQGRASKWNPTPVDFSDLSSEYIGILYEGLLDFELRRAPADDAMLFLNIGAQPVLPFKELDAMVPGTLEQLFDKLKKSGEKIESGDGEGDDGEAEEGEAASDEDDPEAASDEDEGAAGAETAADEALDEGAGEDLVRAIRAKVEDWRERAVRAAKLVKWPKKDTDPRVREKYNRDVAATARGLVQRLILPGGWYLVRWGGTRKGSGTFYTRPQLAGPIVRRALQPLAYTSVQEVKDEATGLVTVTEWAPRTPEEILALKVCDPAMGSGSFLISALRYLTSALVESLHHHGRLEERPDQTICRLADGLPVGHPSNETLPVPKDHPEFEERLRARLKRYVVERCLYGVDLDPLAVELGRTALWVETMDWQLPFGFLDHKLKCGNALVGCWFDRFEDYPILAWEREGGDKEHDRFVHHYREVLKKGKTQRQGDKWTAAIKDRREDVIEPELKRWLEERFSKQAKFEFAIEGKSPEQLHDEALAVFERMHRLPVHDAEGREEIYRKEIAGSRALQRLREAFDTWCALWFWPGDELEKAPGPMTFLEPGEAALEVVRRVRAKEQFFHWELEFADVFTGPESGFHAVVGNPPWETREASSKEFFSNVDPMYRTYGNIEAHTVQRILFERQFDVEIGWVSYLMRNKALTNWFNYAGEPFGAWKDAHVAVGTPDAWHKSRKTRRGLSAGVHPFCHQGAGKPHTYKLFIEVAHTLTTAGGMLGLLVPAGIYCDKDANELRELFISQCEWEWLFGFENREKIFAIDTRSKFCSIIVRKGASTRTVRAAFMRRDLADWENAEQHVLPYPVSRIRDFSPKTLAIPEVLTLRSFRVLDRLISNGVPLGNVGPHSWSVRYNREFNTSDDSALLPPLERWLAQGYSATDYGIFSGPDDRIALPVYEGRLFDQLDFCSAVWISGKGRGAKWKAQGWDQKRFRPQFLMATETYRQSGKRFGQPKVAVMQVSSATNERTVIAALTPDWPGGHKAPFMSAGRDGGLETACLAGIVTSFAFDYAARAAVGSTTVGWYILELLPLPLLDRRLVARLATAVVRVNGAHIAMANIWGAVPPECRGRPWRRLWAVTPHERLRLRAILDASVAELYGLDIDDFAWILRDCDQPAAKVCNKRLSRTLDPKGFWRVDKEQDPELRHTVLSLVAFHEIKRIGLDAFLALNDGDGWMLPETLRLADYGLGRDDRAKQPQPVASRLGDRFLPWQLEQGVEESWEECRRHAETIERILGLHSPQASAAPPGAPDTSPQGAPDPARPVRVVEPSGQAVLFSDAPTQGNLFDRTADVLPAKGRTKK